MSIFKTIRFAAVKAKISLVQSGNQGGSFKVKKFLLTASIGLMAASGFLSSSAHAQEDKWIRVLNRRDVYPIWEVYITPAGDDSWGDDQLSGTTIPAGTSYTWNIPWKGCYVDIKAVTFTGLTTQKLNVDVCGGTDWTIYDAN